MNRSTQNVAVLGSTGSIGQSALEVIDASDGRQRAVALSAHRKLAQLVEQARRYRPARVVATDAEAAARFDWSGLPEGTELCVGEAELARTVAQPDVDVVVAAIVGSAGLRSTWAAVEAGKRVALANKEALVVAGPLVIERARATGAEIVPVDSEHSAVFQLLRAGRGDEVRRIVLTASGGSLRDVPLDELAAVTPAQALAHPTWEMGPKITVDSATMMNKALEIIEARWLFDLPAERIDVVVHPQSIVHSLVEMVDGAVFAQLSPPDMKLPIQYALDFPRRFDGPAERLDLDRAWQLDFRPPDPLRYPAIELGHRVARDGGTAGAVLNGANEAAVAAFLAGEMPFHEIVPACRSVLDEHDFDPRPDLERLMALDNWARKEVSRWVCASSPSR